MHIMYDVQKVTKTCCCVPQGSRFDQSARTVCLMYFLYPENRTSAHSQRLPVAIEDSESTGAHINVSALAAGKRGAHMRSGEVLSAGAHSIVSKSAVEPALCRQRWSSCVSHAPLRATIFQRWGGTIQE